MKATRHFLVDGRVQGVGFRHFICIESNALGLCGWVRNLADGRVEALAQGEEPLLDKLGATIQKGPLRAKVENVVAQDVSVATEFAKFEIKEDGENVWQKKS